MCLTKKKLTYDKKVFHFPKSGLRDFAQDLRIERTSIILTEY